MQIQEEGTTKDTPVVDTDVYLPTKLKSILKMRKKKKAFFFCCDHFLPLVVGKCKFKKFAHNILISDLATSSDEVLVYLCLENNWVRWTEMASHDPPSRDSPIPTKYTERGKKAKEFCGWNKKGLVRYNNLMDMVERDRLKRYGKEVELEYLEYRKEKQGQTKRKDHQRLDESMEGIVKVKNNLFHTPKPTGQDAAGTADTDDHDDGSDREDSSDDSDDSSRESNGGGKKKRNVCDENSTSTETDGEGGNICDDDFDHDVAANDNTNDNDDQQQQEKR